MRGIAAGFAFWRRDRSDGWGHKRISVDVEERMRQRDCNAAVYVTRTRAGLALEVGDWSEGRTAAGPYIATTTDYLAFAVRWVAAMVRLEAARSAAVAVDLSAVEPQLQRIRNALRRLGTMEAHLTAGRVALGKVSEEGSALRDEIRDALRQVEDGLRLPVKPQGSETSELSQPQSATSGH